MSDNSDVNSDFPKPFEKGNGAIISSSDNLGQQVASFLLFVIGLGVLSGFLTLALVSPFIPNQIPHPISFAVIIFWCFVFGIIGKAEVRPAENAVPELLGAFTGFWTVPSGISWWPFGKTNGRYQQVHIGELALSFNFSQIESIDNVSMQSSIIIRCRIKWPLVFVRHARTGEDSQAMIALHGLMERTLRWYVSSKLSTNLPSARKEASKILSGIQASFVSDPLPGSQSQGETIHLEKAVREIAEDISFEIIEVLVKDFTLPEALTKAAERARIEEAEREAETIEIDTLITLIKNMKGADLKNVTDSEIINIVMAERGKVQRIIVDGSASDLVTAGVLAGLRTKDNGESQST